MSINCKTKRLKYHENEKIAMQDA